MTGKTSARLAAGLAALGGVAAVLGAPGVAHAQISGFGGTGSGFTFNNNGFGPATVSGDVLTITNGGGSEANSVYFNTPQSITSFTASFVYQDTRANGNADGFAFVLQNQGINALGTAGGGLGYGGVAPSAAVEFSIYAGGGGSQTGFDTNGAIGYASTGVVNITSGNPILVDLAYDGTTLTETLTDQTTSATANFTYITNLSGVLGANTAFVGFTGGTGAETATQTIRNFSFAPAVSSGAAPEPGALAFLALGIGPVAAGIAARRRYRSAVSM